MSQGENVSFTEGQKAVHLNKGASFVRAMLASFVVIPKRQETKKKQNTQWVYGIFAYTFTIKKLTILWVPCHMDVWWGIPTCWIIKKQPSYHGIFLDGWRSPTSRIASSIFRQNHSKWNRKWQPISRYSRFGILPGSLSLLHIQQKLLMEPGNPENKTGLLKMLWFFSALDMYPLRLFKSPVQIGKENQRMQPHCFL